MGAWIEGPVDKLRKNAFLYGIIILYQVKEGIFYDGKTR
jgi:hypothetical protein